MFAKDFLFKKPVVLKNDPVAHVKRIMSKWKIFELPVLDGKNVFGTINAMDILKAIRRKIDVENLLTYHLAKKKIVKVDKDSSIEEVIRRFLSSKVNVIFVFDRDNFLGYIKRNEILKVLFKEKKSVKEFVSTRFKIISYEDSPKKVIRLIEKFPLIVFKNKRPFIALSKEDGELINYLIDFLLRERKVKLMRQEMKLIKEAGISTSPADTIGKILKKRIVLQREESIGKAAKLMYKNNKSVLPVESIGIVSDISLLRSIV